MSAEDLEKYETEMELTLYREYRDIVRQFSYVVETERRFYLANSVDVQVRNADGEVYFEVTHVRRLGVGHVPPGPVRQERAGADVQGRQRRGAQPAGDRASREVTGAVPGTPGAAVRAQGRSVVHRAGASARVAVQSSWSRVGPTNRSQRDRLRRHLSEEPPPCRQDLHQRSPPGGPTARPSPNDN